MSVGCCLDSHGGDDDLLTPPGIKLPMVKSAVTADELRVVDTLPRDTWYAIESQAELIVIASPVGLVQIAGDHGPIKAMGYFSDGEPGKIEVRTYTAPYVYFVTAVAKGDCELLILPVGVQSESDIVRQLLHVMGPRPPPDDGEDDKPIPPDPPQPVASHVRLVVVEDTLNRSPATAILLNALVGWTAFLDDGNEYRIYDKTSREDKGKQAVKDAGDIGLPAMVLYDKKTGAILKVGSLSPTVDELKATIGGLTGG